MKKTILSSLLTAVLFAFGLNVQAQFEDGKYLIKNIATNKYWGAGNSWGTQASLLPHAEYVTLLNQPEGVYHMETQVSNGGTAYFFNGSFMDNGSPVPLTITAVAGGYTIANGETYYGWDGESTVLGTNLTADSENAVWEIVSIADAKANLENATEANPIDATFLIEDHNFGRNNRNQDKWSMVAANQNLCGGDNTNMCAESYHSLFTLSQTITGVPNGVYKMTAQGFYRQDGSDTEHLPVFYINTATGTFPEKTGSENNMTDASNSFSQGAYTIDPIEVIVTDGTITLGAKLEGNTSLWCIWDNFVLYYCGVDMDALRNRYTTTLADAQAAAEKPMEASVKTALQAVIEAYKSGVDTESKTALEEAISALTNALVTANTSIAAYVRLKAALDEGTAFLNTCITNGASADYVDALDAIKSSYENGEYAEGDMEGIIAGIWQILTPVALEQTAEGSDMTLAIVNPNINGADGWTIERPIGGNGPMLGNDKFEYWAGNASSRDDASFDYWQEIELPNGKYIVGADMYNSLNGEAGAEFNASCGVYGSSGALESIALVYTDGTDLMPYITEAVNVINGKLRIGVKSVERMGARWFVADNFKLTYAGKADYQDVFVQSLTEAKAAQGNEDYSIITGSERTALDEAIANAEAFDMQDEDQFLPLSIALGEATKDFVAAYPSYKALKDLQASMAFTELPYADEYYSLLLPALLEADAFSAEDADEKVRQLKEIYLKYIESNAMAVAVKEAKDITSIIVNPNADNGIEGWTTTMGIIGTSEETGEDILSGGSIGIRSNEPFTDASGNSEWNYFDGGNWGAQAWNVSFSQDITLPAGKYYLTVTSRASYELSSFNLFANEEKVEMRHIGAGDMTNGDFGRGWNDNSLEFSLDKEQTVTIGVQGVTTMQYNWMSFTRFRLVKLDGGEVLAADKAAFDAYKTEQKTAADALSQDGDSEASQKLITDAKAAIDALTYDEKKTLDENKAAVDAIVNKLKDDLAAQRESETTGIAYIKAHFSGNVTIYDMNGRKVQMNKVRKGQMYIINGKKVMIE